MAHDTHAHDEHHHDDHAHGKAADRPKGATMTASYVVALLVAGLLIAALNFIGVMSADHGGGHGGHGGEKGSMHHTQEATSNQTLHGETGLGKDQETTTQHEGTTHPQDEAQREGHAH